MQVTQRDAERAAQDRLRVISAHFTPIRAAAPSSLSANGGSPTTIEPPQLLKIAKGGRESDHAGNPIVVGGMVLDVLALPDEKSAIAAGTTVPGKIKQAPGGVGRNIAQCIAALASGPSSRPPPLLISVVGRDPAGDALVGHLSRLGIPDRGVRRSSTASTAAVAVVFGGGGEVEAAVADVGILDDEHEAKLQASWIRDFAVDISAAPIMVVDANLHEATLRAAVDIAARAGVPVWFEPVSVTKSKRAAAVFSGITVVSPNQNELKAMAEATGRCCAGSAAAVASSDSANDGSGGASGAAEEELRALAPYAEAVLDAGVKHIVLTLGPNGAAVITRTSGNAETGSHGAAIAAYHVPALPSRVVGLTGAGDSLVAGCISGLLSGADLGRSLHRGVAAASVVIRSPENVPETLTDASVTAVGEQPGAWLRL